jgi:hypothetical protein
LVILWKAKNWGIQLEMSLPENTHKFLRLLETKKKGRW